MFSSIALLKNFNFSASLIFNSISENFNCFHDITFVLQKLQFVPTKINKCKKILCTAEGPCLHLTLHNGMNNLKNLFFVTTFSETKFAKIFLLDTTHILFFCIEFNSKNFLLCPLILSAITLISPSLF